MAALLERERVVYWLSASVHPSPSSQAIAHLRDALTDGEVTRTAWIIVGVLSIDGEVCVTRRHAADDAV